MATFAYRAAGAHGAIASGRLEANDRADALAQLRAGGRAPLSLAPVAPATARGVTRPASRRARAATGALVAELAVLLRAELPLDRALALALENVDEPAAAAAVADLLAGVREGLPLSRAMARRPALFPPIAVAMAEAGEANGRLGQSLERLATMLEQDAALRRTVTTSMIYPAALLTIAVGVVSLMLLFVVPQFESLFATATVPLPLASRVVMGASRFARAYGLLLVLAVVVAGLGLRVALARPAARRRIDRAMLDLPQLGALVRRIEAARFAHTLGALLDGGVPLPGALALAARAVGNRVVAEAVTAVAARVREGGDLTAPLAAADVLPRLALGFLRTGEETSQLAPMMARLAEVLDRDVTVRLQRLIGVLTPAITVILGALVAGIIASVMSAILGFNDLAVTQ